MCNQFKDLKTEQVARQEKAKLRSKQTAEASKRKLKEHGKESALLYGQQLYSHSLEL